MTFPSITPAQIVAAFFAAIGPVLVLLGADLSVIQGDAVDDLRVVALGLFGADAAIRIGRNLGNKAPSINQVQGDAVSDVPSDHPSA